jgi:hypothetical protein
LGVLDDLAEPAGPHEIPCAATKQRHVEIRGSAARIHAASRAAVLAQAA